jgi:hypothetical protein
MGAGCKHVRKPAPGRTAPQMRNDARAATPSEARAHGAHASAGAIVRTGSDADDENAFSSFSRTYLRRGASPQAVRWGRRLPAVLSTAGSARNQH